MYTPWGGGWSGRSEGFRARFKPASDLEATQSHVSTLAPLSPARPLNPTRNRSTAAPANERDGVRHRCLAARPNRRRHTGEPVHEFAQQAETPALCWWAEGDDDGGAGGTEEESAHFLHRFAGAVHAIHLQDVMPLSHALARCHSTAGRYLLDARERPPFVCHQFHADADEASDIWPFCPVLLGFLLALPQRLLFRLQCCCASDLRSFCLVLFGLFLELLLLLLLCLQPGCVPCIFL